MSEYVRPQLEYRLIFGSNICEMESGNFRTFHNQTIEMCSTLYLMFRILIRDHEQEQIVQVAWKCQGMI